MQLSKSLLLGSAAGLLAVSGASAADLPSRSKGPAVEYVKVCDAFGAGYYYIPGTDTCLKVGGYARADYGVRNVTNQWGGAGTLTAQPFVAGPLGFAGVGANATGGLGGNFSGQPVPAVNAVNAIVGPPAVPAVPAIPAIVDPLGALLGISGKARNSSGFSALGGLELDARSQTSWGTLRGFIRYEISSGNFGLGGTNFGTGSASLDKAFVQFAGITAGRAQSFFDFFGDAYPLDISRGSDQSTTLLAYTASFGGGFSATISIEDPVTRRKGIGSSQRENLAVAAAAPDTFFANSRRDAA